MLKFHQIVLRKFFALFLVLFLIMGAIVYYWMKDFYLSQAKNSLIQTLELVSYELDKNSDLDTFAKEIKNRLNIRVTIIDLNGKVIAESHKDKNKMDNHKYRDEVMQSNTQEYGYKVRYSKTIKQDLLYVVKHHQDNKTNLYVRLAMELKSVNDQILSLGLKILAVLIPFFIAIMIVTYKINIQIQNEMQNIVNFLKALTKKRKSTYISSSFSQEFSLVTGLLTKVSQILTKKEKQKSKYTKKLQISNQQKDDIISAISHEFKNPIAVINGYSQTLLDDENLNPNIRKKFLTKIYKNGERLSGLIDTLRLSIKLDSGGQSLNYTTINLRETVLDIVENLKINYPTREAIIKGAENITVKADAALFGIVISNLVENAFKYSEDEVIIEFNENRISVIDSGIGISNEDLQNITGKFYRVHKHSWNNSLGLGLFIVNTIVNLHKFKLEISSEENIGSTFSVIF